MKKSEMWYIFQLAGSFITIIATAIGLMLPNISVGVIIAFGVAAIATASSLWAGALRERWAYYEERAEYKAHLRELETFYDKALHRAQEFEEYARATEKE